MTREETTMTLNEAIKHAEEVAKEQDELCKRYDDASRYYRSHNEDIVSANAKKCRECFECAKEHRQLAEWLKDYKRLLEQEPKTGHWIIVEELHGEWEGTKKYACDKCGEKVGVFKSNYCPNCGRRMFEPQESEVRE